MIGALALLFTTLTIAPQAAARPAGVAVSGVVQDQTGAVLPGANVDLRLAGSTASAQSVASTPAGAFRFDGVAPGRYDVRVEFPGFKTMIVAVRVGTRAPGALTIVMPIEGVTQEVSVRSGGAETNARASANLNAITIDEDTLDDL